MRVLRAIGKGLAVLWMLYCLLWWLAWIVLPIYFAHSFEDGVLVTVGTWMIYWAIGSIITWFFMVPASHVLGEGNM